MSLVLTLASRNLLQDRLRFIASLIGIVLSVVLVMVQMGLYNGFGRMLTIMVDHASTDLWIMSSGAKFFEDLSLVDTSLRDRLLTIEGIDKVIPVVAGFSAWSLPDGSMVPVFVVASDFSEDGLLPWNVVEGTVESLTTPGIVAIDRAYFDRLGVAIVLAFRDRGRRRSRRRCGARLHRRDRYRAQTLYSSTKEHLYEFATLRAIGASNSYIYKVISCQALINAVVGFLLAALIGAGIVRFTSNSPLQVVITTNLMIELFVLTLVMSIVSAFAAIFRVIRVDPAIALTR